jgi:hypothetical protein
METVAGHMEGFVGEVRKVFDASFSRREAGRS